jgi:hypothetical protein
VPDGVARAAFRIAGLVLEVERGSPLADVGLPGSLAAFALKEAAGPIDISVRLEDAGCLPALPPEDRVYDPGEIWRVFRGRDGAAFAADIDYEGRESSRRPRARLMVDGTWSRARLVEIRGGGKPAPTMLTVGAGELLLRTRIIAAEGLVLHACGIDDNGRGLLIAGHSGEGKSTQAALWAAEAGVVVMNEDRVAARLSDGGAAVHGTPWGGSAGVALNHEAPLAAILLIEKAHANQLLPLPPAEAIALLAARAFLPWWDPALLSRALDVLERLVRRVPVFRLRCRPEPAVIPLVRAAL